jgi:hypothetical protein
MSVFPFLDTYKVFQCIKAISGNIIVKPKQTDTFYTNATCKFEIPPSLLMPNLENLTITATFLRFLINHSRLSLAAEQPFQFHQFRVYQNQRRMKAYFFSDQNNTTRY